MNTRLAALGWVQAVSAHILSLALAGCAASAHEPLASGADGATHDAGNVSGTDQASALGKCQVNDHCDDGDACTLDVCRPWGCEHFAKLCWDSNPCTLDSCSPKVGCTTTPYSCDDGDMCTADKCEWGYGCQHVPTGCSDNNPCTIDTCIKNACQGKPVADDLLCPAGNGMCAAGQCVANVCQAGPLLGAFSLSAFKGFNPVRLAELSGGKLAALGHTGDPNSGDWKQRVATIELKDNGVAIQEAPGWQSVPGVNAIHRASDGSLILCGENPTTSGTFAWFGRSKGMAPPTILNFDSPMRRNCLHLSPTADGGAVISGWAEATSNVFATAWVAHVDGNDKVLWSTVINLDKYNTVTDAVALPSGQVVVAVHGDSGKYYEGTPRLLRLDGQGAIVANTLLDNKKYLQVQALIPRPNGAVTALTQVYPGQAVAGIASVRLDGENNLLWSKVNVPAGYLQSARTTATGTLLALSEAKTGTMLLIGLDDHDEVAWQNGPATAGKLPVTDALPLADGRIAMAGLIDPTTGPGYTNFASGWLGLADPWGHVGCKAAGVCATLASCDDGDPCTADSCAEPAGCSHLALPKDVTCTAN
ncbi:MAG: hypothetical protein HY902_01305 [Deltaproteobacteria bacterium]|nr:hypothetical protein [Deltaproteobacteria bacterium]